MAAAALKQNLAAHCYNVATFLTLSTWIAGLIVLNLWWFVDLALLPRHPWIALGGLLFKVALMLVPLRVPPPGPVQRFLRFSMTSSKDYFPVKVVWEDKDAFKQGPYVVAYEPHSVLPQGICIFSQYATDAVPPALANARILASSAAFWAPVMRHLWWWLGIRPVSRRCFATLLAKGKSVAVCPGGVREVMYMERGHEVAYLRKRRGFVRMALQAGAPLVPVFAFGQSDLYSYCRLFYDFPKHMIPRAQWASFVRRIGYVPMLIFGVAGSFMPKKVPMHIVVGRPIPLPKLEQPTAEQVEEHLGRFIGELERLFREHKAAAGHGDATLTIY